MAFRRRRGFRRRGRPVQRQRLAWIPTGFVQSAVDPTGVDEFRGILWDIEDVGVDAAYRLNQTYTIKRIILKGSVSLIVPITAVDRVSVPYTTAILHQDIDDLAGIDPTLTGLSSAWTDSRILWYDAGARSIIEVPSAQLGTVTGIDIRIDVDITTNVKVRNGEVISFAFYLASPGTTPAVVSQGLFSGVSRVLMVAP